MPNVTNETEENQPVFDPPVGITDPPIDRLLEKVSSKYALAIFAAKRARQIIGPLVTPEPGEKPLSIALREIDAGLLEYEEGR